MGQITLHSVPPGANVVILVRAVQTGPAGTTYSDYTSLPYSSPTTGASGGTITTSNSSTNVQLVGGSIFAIPSSTYQFPSATGTQKFFNDSSDPNHNSPITLSGGRGVILNQYGIAAYKDGSPQFVIDATTGKAFFAGTVTAGSVKIGPGVDPTGTKNGIYINPFNYWYEDGSWSAKGSDIAGALIGSQILKPSSVSGLTSNWNSSTNLTISWTFDTTAIVAGSYSNQNTKDFILTLTAGGVTKTVIVQANKLSSAQSYILTPTLNKSLFGVAQVAFTSITVAAEDTFGNIGVVSTITGATYNTPLLTPTSLPLVGVNNGYTVSYTAPTDPSYSNIEIAESTTSVSGPWTTVYTGTLNPATILSSNLSQRWVQARFVDILGASTPWYTNTTPVTPISPVTLSTAAPQEATVVSAAFTTTTAGAGTGEDITLSVTAYNKAITVASGTSTITYTTGTTPHNFVNGDQVIINGITGGTGFNTYGIVSNATTYTFQISGQNASGTPTSYTSATVQYYGITYIAKLTSGSKTAYIYLSPPSYTTTSLSWTITKSSMFNQLGAYYSSFSGNFISVSISGIQSAGTGTATINAFSRASSITTTTPVPTILSIIDGYSVTYDYGATNATSAEIYQRYSTTTAVPALAWALTDTQTSPQTYIRDAITVTAVSGSGTSIVVTSPVDNDGFSLTGLTTGYPIVGTGIAAASSSVTPTFITAVAANTPTTGQYTLTLNQAMTGSASGTYTMQSLAYSGSSPASVYSNYYTGNIQVAVRYYDDFGNGSNYFISSSTYQPINPTTSLIQNAVQVGGTAGAIYVGSSASTGARILLGVNSYYNTSSSYSGIFAYDGSATTNSAPTTSIISNAGTGGFTFSTVNAHIADWNITTNKIENTITTPGTTSYTGLSGSGAYSFWAGATATSTTGPTSDSQSAFWVKPTGAVQASNITITGGSLNVGGNFIVNNTGILSATGANITGAITAQSGSFTGNVKITDPGSLYSGTALLQTISSVSIPSANTARYVLSAAHTLTTSSTVYISGVTGATTGSFSGVYKVSAINVVANSFDVTITGIAGTPVIATTPPIAQVVDITSGYILNSSGFVFNNSTTKGITTLDAGTGLLTTSSANIGGWLISDATGISKTSGSGTIKLDASNAYISASSSTYTAGIATPNTNSASDVVLWAGGSTARSTANNFYVTADGTLHATSAVVSGNITANAVAANTSITTNTFSLTGGNGDYWSSTGTFQFGGSTGISRSTPTGAITIGSAIIVPAAQISGTITAGAVAASISITTPTITGGSFTTTSSATQKITINSSNNNAIQFTDASAAVVGNITPLNLSSSGVYGLIINSGLSPDSTWSGTGSYIYLTSGASPEARMGQGGSLGPYVTVNSTGASISGGTNSIGVKISGTLLSGTANPNRWLTQSSVVGQVFSSVLTILPDPLTTPTGGNAGDLWIYY